MTRYRAEEAHVSMPTLFHLIADQLPTDRFVERSIQTISGLSGSAWNLGSHCSPPVVRRLRDDAEARVAYLAHLCAEPSANAKASLPGLLLAASGWTDELRDWCRSELDRQFQDDGVAQHGFDLGGAQIRSVGQVLLDLLTPGSA